ncbi:MULTISPECIES: helix-turn-helix transcriptional regulator [Aeromicrobium]|uniref:helix-turn-helix transcriptional regulator n=1 Tax=Aeromicrobium TaxID=2040 RepID=UPI0006FF41EE|nr:MULTISPECIES: helix-turn-helix transcriptional regulator [Aeromicrobium]KQX74297.1 DNA-binding protein [Aeromicrobium sp. Root472D3]MCL8249771.1 helix-turn-helix transcriptional regulator [Aeromicrobium fastidiosum]
MPADRSALGAFLRSRRDRLTPPQAGITAFPGARRVPGLRREELAVLAGLSPDYYSRVEQGRQPNVSAEVLDALARALRLDDTERAHLHTLAAPQRRRASRPTTTHQQADPGLLRLMTTLDHVPALVLGRSGTILATNHLLRCVLGRRFEPGSSLMRYLFLDPDARQRIVNWPSFAQASVGALRRELGLHPDDVQLQRLVAELRGADPDVARWWDDHGVRDYASVPKQIDHPVAGPLSFDIELVTMANLPDQHLIVYTVQPDSPTARALPLVASWEADVQSRAAAPTMES